MAELSAYQAAVLADDVYALTRLATLDQAIKYIQAEYGDIFAFGEDDVLKGVTGGPGFIKCRTAFGFTLIGKNSRKGEAFIIFRGTQYLADWLTNLNIGVSSSSSGQPVHDGFNKSFKSMKLKLTGFMDVLAKNGIHTIHCIGHSLGGALATICGEWIRSAYKRKPYIYTFGSPRVGLYTFASHCTSTIGSGRIFRAYHKTDIVPCIPIWPYIHTPSSGIDYYLYSPGVVPMAEYHGIDKYVDSVEDAETWKALESIINSTRNENGIKQWLRDKSPIGLTISSIEWLNDALMFVLEKCMNGAAWLISKSFSTSFTLMDQLAYILRKGVDLSDTTSSWVMHLIRRIMQVLGMRHLIKMADLTREFIKTILIYLQNRINQYTRSVLNKVMVSGRAV